MLFEIKLVKYLELGDANAAEELQEKIEKDSLTFENVVKNVEQILVNSKSFFATHNFAKACDMYLKAIRALDICRLQNDEEERRHKELLITLYRNLCVCYNKRNLPK